MVTVGRFGLLRGALWRILGAPGETTTETSAIDPVAATPLEAAVALCLDDRWLEAREALRPLAGPACRCARTWTVLGVAHGRLGDWRRAQAALEQACRLTPGGTAGELLPEVRGIRRWERAVARRPWDAQAHFYLGVLLLAWEWGDEGLAHLQRAAALRPDWAEPRLYAALEFHYRGDVPAAERAYAEVLALDPGHDAAQRGLDALRHGRLPDEAATEEPDVWRAVLAGS